MYVTRQLYAFVVVGHRAVCVVDGLRAEFVDGLRVVCVAFVPYMCCRPSSRLLSCRFWKPPRTGEVLPKFYTYSVVFLVLQSGSCRRGLGVARRLHRLAIAPLACLHRHPRYKSPLFLTLGHVTQLGVSRPKEIRSEVCRSLYICDRICFGLSTFFGQPVVA